MLNIAICDDCPTQLDVILAHLDNYQKVRTDIKLCCESFKSGKEIIAKLDKGGFFELYLLDILMPEQDGIELAQEIRARDADAYIIFLTASPDYALHAFEVSATQYILKPFDENKLFPVLDKIISVMQPEDERHLILSTTDKIVKIPFSSIICVELSSRSMFVYLTDGNVMKSKTIRSTFAEAAAPLLADPRFICPHKSFALNMMWVEELNNSEFIMKHGLKVPIPRYRYAEAKTAYFAWLSERGIRKMGGGQNG
jgi:DNA-binding LytR/AlgR family response regulator